MASGLVRDIVERHNDSTPPTLPRGFSGSGGSSKTGFPAVHHRSKAASAFKRARQDRRVQSGLSESRERLVSTANPRLAPEDSNVGLNTPRPAEDWMSDISRANEEVIARMGVDEIAREKEDIVDKFGVGINDLMAKVKEARERRANLQAAPDASQNRSIASLTPAPDTTSSSPHARAIRKIRFAEPTEADVHVYESQPSSPKRTLALLPPPEDVRERGDISSLGSFKGTLKTPDSSVGPSTSSHGDVEVELPEEGTPEDIRRRFFPSEAPPEANPALAWMLSSSSPPSESIPSSCENAPSTQESGSFAQEARYSLSGVRLSPAQINDLPTHLGLHHHATSSLSPNAPAGYTLSDLLLLSRSSVPAQRASILGVLAKLLKIAREEKYSLENGQPASQRAGPQTDSQTIIGPSDGIDLDALRRDLLDTAIDALGEKGGVGQRGVELLWEAIVGFVRSDYGVVELKDLAGVDLTPKKSSAQSSTSHPTATGSSKSEARYSPSNSSRRTPDVIVSLPVGMILPMLKQHLVSSPSSLSRTHSQVLEILLVLSHFAAHARTILHPETDHDLITVLLNPHLRSSFGPEDHEPEDTHASPTSIHILQALACSSRDNALKLTGPADVLLRYLTEPRSPLSSAQQHSSGNSSLRLSMALLEETLRFYAILSQYGLYSQFATIAQEHFSRIGTWILDTMRTGLGPALVSLSSAYIRLMGALIVCATDPHQTTPNHDILWTQVRGWDWAEWTLEVAELLASVASAHSPADVATRGLWADILHTLAVWMEGASVNGVKGGEAEKSATIAKLRPLLEMGRGAWRVVSNAVATLRTWDMMIPLDKSGMCDFATAVDLVAATTRLAVACFRPGVSDEPLHFPAEEIRVLCVRFADKVSSHGPFALVFGHDAKPPENVHLFVKPLSTLLTFQLKFWRQSMLSTVGAGEQPITRHEDWAAQALLVLGVLLPGDEDHAQWIIKSICETINPNFVHKLLPSTDLPQEIWGKDGINILLPFLNHSLRPVPSTGGEEIDQHQPIYIAPTLPTPVSILRCTTLNMPSISRLQEAWDSRDADAVLPLGNDWPMLPLNHLLRSGTSPVFHALPPSWDASETDVVRASLLLVRIAQEVRPRIEGGEDGFKIDRPWRISSDEAIFACMKVFMLEHGQQQIDSGEEVFRDLVVTNLMEDILKPFTYSYSQDNHSHETLESPSSSLEWASKTLLGADTPFYQFYTDFLALYDAISFSHPLFARLLLPPVSMSYPIDYRKLLFGDFGHVLRTLKTDVPDVLCGDVREYLWPVEHDAHVIGWYLKSLMSDTHGLVHWIAVHHVAANIWPEFTSGHPVNRERAAKLLNALLQQSKNEIVREVALYRQPEHEVWAPPRCFVSGEKVWKVARLEWTEHIGGERAKTTLQSLFSM